MAKIPETTGIKQGNSPRLRKTAVAFFLLLAIAVLYIHYLTAPAIQKEDAPPPEETTAWNNVDDYLKEHTYPPDQGPFPLSVLSNLTANVQGDFSLYLEDLNTEKWWGIKETNSFNAWSLFKVPLLVAVLKKIELNQLSSKYVPIQIQKKVFTINSSSEINGLSVKELAKRMIEASDDEASIALGMIVPWGEFQASLKILGLPCASPSEPANTIPKVSPKEYANLLRNLYFSNYMKPPFSSLALSLMSATVYNRWIEAGVPSRVRVAHKVGFNDASGEFHDCGIIYLKNRPYILCIMSKNSNLQEFRRISSAVSSQIYEFMKQNSG